MDERLRKFPHPVPEVPKEPLYLALLLPPAAPLFGLFLELVAGRGAVFISMNFVAIAVGMGFFYQAVSRRYRGVSRSFLL
ncbi:MAG: hypothetical protein EOP88_06435 [Verrucomicrobiaceae bacterium]|nr:MAG: hypothetical protein EOP88_06435 [Verrucomicrobiaceae bacterium]